jgi:hypothetical protein
MILVLRHPAIEFGLIVLVALVLCSLVFNNPNFTGEWTNADTLVLTSFVWDVRHHDYAWTGFRLPRIPSLFPDLAVYSAFQLLIGDYRWAIFGYAIAQFLAFIFAAGWLISLATDVRLAKTAGLLTLLLTLVIVVDLHFPPIVAHFEIFLLVMHFGAFLMSLIAVGLAILLIERWRLSSGVLLGACCCAAFLSDKIFAFDLAIPLAGALIVSLQVRITSLQRATAILSAVAVGMGSATFVDRYLIREADLAIAQVLSHAAQFLEQTPHYLGTVAVAAIGSLLLPVILFIAAPLLVRWERTRQEKFRAPRRRLDFAAEASDFRAFAFLWIFMAFAMAAVIALGAAVFVIAPQSYRYLTVPLFWPIIFSAITILRLARSDSTISYSLLTLLIAMMATLAAPGIRVVPAFARWGHPLAACIVEHKNAFGLRAGLSDYWLSRPVTISTNWTIQVDQIDFAGTPFVWQNDPFWYLRSFSTPGQPPEYNFIVTDRLDLEAIRQRYGDPDRITRCDVWTIWVYRDTTGLWRNLVRGWDRLPLLMKSEGK